MTKAPELSAMQAAILRVLHRAHPGAVYCTADVAFLVARQPGRDSNRKHSAFISAELHELEARGLVRRRDKGTPISWTKA